MSSHFGRFLKAVRAPILGLVVGIGITSVCLKFSGESPMLLVQSFYNAFLTPFGLGYTLYYATPLMFTGLACALSFHCGLFNIGADGQLYVGALAVVVAAHFFPGVSPWAGIPMGILAAILAGAFWGSIAGALKAWRGSHEVIVTILLNFIAYSVVDYAILYPLRNGEVQNPETSPLPAAFQIPLLTGSTGGIFQSTPLNVSIGIALIAAVLCHLFLFRTTWGYELRTVGQNPVAARFAGISPGRSIFLALLLSGGLAGLEGVNEVMGSTHKLIQGFSAEYGFTGIAVALAARNQPIAVLFSAILFGGLQNSAREVEFLSDKVTKELFLVIQAVLIGFIAADYLIDKLFQNRQKNIKPNNSPFNGQGAMREVHP
jgi:general nucleoside transport system permease protein